MDILSNETLDFASKGIAVLMSVFAAYKVLNELLSGKHARIRQDIDYYDKLVQACQNNEHPLKIEKLFECLYGKRARAEIISQFLTNWPSPSIAISRYLRARDLVEIKDNYISFEGLLRSKPYRATMKTLHLAVYGLFFFLAWMPLIMKVDYSKYTFNKYLMLLTYMAAMMIMSFSTLRSCWKISVAEKLVDESEQLKTNRERDSQE